MTSLPIPFLTAVLLLILAASNHRQLVQTSTGRVFALILYVNAASMICIGFRWSLDLTILLPIAAALAVISAALMYLAFCSLGRRGPVIDLSRDWVHFVPVAIILILAIVQPLWNEFFLILVKLFYAGLLLNLARQPATSLQLVRLGWFSNTQKALWVAAALLLTSVIIDIAITIDFILFDGRHAASLVGFVNLGLVMLLGVAVVMAGKGKTQVTQSDEPESIDDVARAITSAIAEGAVDAASDTDEADAQLLDELNQLLLKDRLFADTELNLQKLARKAGVPARAVSRAINAHANKNVSQWINSARIDAACELLADENVSVTQAMFDAGFVTKSNFNREFKRIKGCSPSQWRANQ